MPDKNRRILAILASPRKGNTHRVLQQINDSTDSIDMQIIHIASQNIKHCVGCEKCITNGDCVLKDDMDSIMQKMKSADAIILASPIYMGNISGDLKVFIDRTCKWFHRQELIGKPLLGILTTVKSGLSRGAEYLREIGYYWACRVTDIATFDIDRLHGEFNSDEVIRPLLSAIDSPPIQWKPPFRALILFQVQKALAMNVMKIDRDYWIERGWDQANYFFDCKIGPLKRLFLRWFFRRLDRRVKASRRKRGQEMIWE